MPFLLAFLTFLVIIGISGISEYMKRRMVSKPVLEGLQVKLDSVQNLPPVAVLPATDEGTSRVEGYVQPETLFYHRGHVWVAIQSDETVVVGIDEFASTLFGGPDSIELPAVGDRCRQGEKGICLSRNGKSLEMLFPLDGNVIAVNDHALANPEILAEEPYGKGWLFMVKAYDLKRNLRNLLSGSIAKRWLEDSAFEIRSMFSGKLGLVFQDGGLPEKGLVDYFEMADWRTLVSRLFTFESGDPGL